jgi:hypothetical protein
LATDTEKDAWRNALEDLKVEGIAPRMPLRKPRPGEVSLADALKVADDFVFLRTTAKSVRAFLALFDFSEVDFLTGDRPLLIMRGETEGTVVIFDERRQPRLGLQVDATSGYESRGGVEYPAGGLQVVHLS